MNGLRAASGSDGFHQLAALKLDVLLLQEVKAPKPDGLKEFLGPISEQFQFECIELSAAKKPGYSGVLIGSKAQPVEVVQGLGIPSFDDEGRWIEMHFHDFVAISSYFPNSQRDHARLPFKLEFIQSAGARLRELDRKTSKPVVIGGDFNVAPEEVDLANPKANQKNAGFLPEEREAFRRMLREAQFVDTFRRLFPESKGAYTWWSYRPGVRERNIGWRLDHILINESHLRRVRNIEILPRITGSDHCPVILELSPNP